MKPSGWRRKQPKSKKEPPCCTLETTLTADDLLAILPMVATVGPFKGCVKVSAFFTVAFSRNRRNRKRSKWSVLQRSIRMDTHVVVTTHKLMASTSNNIYHIAVVAVVRRFESVIARLSTLKTGSLMTSSLSSVSTVLTNTSRSFSCSACPSGKPTTLG